MSRTATFPALVQDFFQRYLVVERRLRPNTVLAYRDAIKLFLRFLEQDRGRTPDALQLEEVLTPEAVLAFLAWLERERKCGMRSRNHRLAVVKSFALYVARVAPEHLERCQRVRALSCGRVDQPEVEYLEQQEAADLLQATGHGPYGLRDRALALLLYNTGARVQEIVDVNVSDLHLEAAPHVLLRGKGGKERTCPLWARTTRALKRWLDSLPRNEADSPVFVSVRGTRITRSGVAYVLRRTARRAGLEHPACAKRVTPHVIRHTTAMHLLEAKVDLSVIANWLGHASLSTTHDYVVLTDRMKQRALLASLQGLPELLAGSPPQEDLLAWLESLSTRSRYVESPSRDRPGVRLPARDST